MSVMEMKDFDAWNEDKKVVHSSAAQVQFKDREVWWCKVGINVGYEINGKTLFLRPVLIIRKISSNTFIGIPLTRKEKGVIKKVSHCFTIPWVISCLIVKGNHWRAYLNCRRFGYLIQGDW